MALRPRRTRAGAPPRRRMRRAIRRHGVVWGLTRSLGVVLVAGLVLGGLGTGFQRVATQRDARLHPPPGRMVSVDGHALHLYCVGAGEPTVLLDGGLGEWSIHWSGVQARLVGLTRVCTYDRAGYGWSPATATPRTAPERARELHTLLKNAEVVPPYVLVGHGAAGLHLTGYVSEHADWVAGLVLVDAVPADMAELYERGLAPILARMRHNTPAAQFGILRLTGPPGGIGAHPKGANFRRQAAHPGFFETYIAEAAHLSTDAEWAAASPLPAGLPVIVVAGEAPLGPGQPVAADVAPERYNRLWRSHQQEFVEHLPGARLVLVPRPGADLPLEAPEAVADAVAGLVHRVRGDAP